jgi:hypothetical protein
MGGGRARNSFILSDLRSKLYLQKKHAFRHIFFLTLHLFYVNRSKVKRFVLSCESIVKVNYLAANIFALRFIAKTNIANGSHQKTTHAVGCDG